jgi:hypothetical protein
VARTSSAARTRSRSIDNSGRSAAARDAHVAGPSATARVAQTVPRLQNDYLVAGLRYPARGQQASEPRPHHHNPHAPLPPSICPFGDILPCLKDALSPYRETRSGRSTA